jgi:hypothetical protein
MTSLVSNYYLNELKLYAESIGPILKNWHENCQRPGEFRKRINAILPTTITHYVALFFFPKVTAIGLVATAVMPAAVEDILHNAIIQGLDEMIDKLNMTSTQKKTAVVVGIAMTGYLTLNRYYERI